MNDGPSNAGEDAQTGGSVVPQTTGSSATPVQQRALGLWGRTEAGLSEGLQQAGTTIEAVHRRLLLVIAALIGILILGAIFRSLDFPKLNYLLIALFGVGALYAFLNPIHIVGVLLVGGGIGVAKGADGARDALLGYARLLGRCFIAFLVPLLVFALAPGDRSLGTSLSFLALAPVAVIAIWMFGHVAPKVEKAVFVGLPLGALLLAAGNMLVPQSSLAALGIPAWLRTARPQDEELAQVEALIEKRRNEARAEQLHAIRLKIEAGEPLTAADEAIVANAQKDRATLTGWVGQKYDAALAGIQEHVAERKEAAAVQALDAAPKPGLVSAPRETWSNSVMVPAGYRLCADPGRGPGSYVSKCTLRSDTEGIWYPDASGRCEPNMVARIRFRSHRVRQDIRYRFTPVGQACSS
jgi:hypothetical protein